MTEKLTEEQARFAISRVSQWLRLRSQFEDLSKEKGRLATIDYVNRFAGEEAKRLLLSQLAADVDHSALLLRLLRGRDPLPEAPPTEHAYPVYPDWPYVDE